MKFMMDPKSNQPSVTLSIFVVTAAVCLFKLLFSGVSLGNFSMAPFGGSDFGAALGAAGLIYAGRRYTDRKDKEEKDE